MPVIAMKMRNRHSDCLGIISAQVEEASGWDARVGANSRLREVPSRLESHLKPPVSRPPCPGVQCPLQRNSPNCTLYVERRYCCVLPCAPPAGLVLSTEYSDSHPLMISFFIHLRFSLLWPLRPSHSHPHPSIHSFTSRQCSASLFC